MSKLEKLGRRKASLGKIAKAQKEAEERIKALLRVNRGEMAEFNELVIELQGNMLALHKLLKSYANAWQFFRCFA